MKRGSLLQFLGIWASSITSIFAAHALMAKSDIKDLTKTSKKMRPSQSQNAPEEGAQDGAPPPAEELQDVPSDVVDRYPWKKNIVTTTFWIGEKPTSNNPVPNHKSSWDANWAQNYGGTDTPDRSRRTSEFIPDSFMPRQNPFYIALPYNDKTSNGHKPRRNRSFPGSRRSTKGLTNRSARAGGLPSAKAIAFATRNGKMRDRFGLTIGNMSLAPSVPFRT